MKPSRRGGFTLLELIVVITIIGILGTFVVMNVAGSTERTRRAKVTNDVKAIYNAATAYESQTGAWPDSIEMLVNAKDENGVRIAGTLKEEPKDPWGGAYLYEVRDDGPVITCYGKDGSPGGEGENEDQTYPSDVNS